MLTSKACSSHFYWWKNHLPAFIFYFYFLLYFHQFMLAPLLAEAFVLEIVRYYKGILSCQRIQSCQGDLGVVLGNP